LPAAAAAARAAARAAELWRLAARLAEDRVRDAELARRAWRRAWQLDTLDLEARTALKRLLALAGDWRGYRDLLEREARKVVRIDEKIEVYRELAAFQRQVLRDDRAAADVYGLLLQLAPADAEALAARAGDFSAVARLWEAEGNLAAAAAALERGGRAALAAALYRRAGDAAAAARLVARPDPSAKEIEALLAEAAEAGPRAAAALRYRIA